MKKGTENLKQSSLLKALDACFAPRELGMDWVQLPQVTSSHIFSISRHLGSEACKMKVKNFAEFAVLHAIKDNGEG